MVTELKTPYTENHEEEYGIPPLGELCEDTAAPGEEKFPGGEEEALRRLDEHMKRTVRHHSFSCHVTCHVSETSSVKLRHLSLSCVVSGVGV